MSANAMDYQEAISAEKMRTAQIAYQNAIAEGGSPTQGFAQGDSVVTVEASQASSGIPEGMKGRVLGMKDGGATVVVKFGREHGTRKLEPRLLRIVESRQTATATTPTSIATTTASLPPTDSESFSWSLEDFLAAQGMDKVK